MSGKKLICVCCENAMEGTEVLRSDPRHVAHSYAAITSNVTWVRLSLVGNSSVSRRTTVAQFACNGSALSMRNEGHRMQSGNTSDLLAVNVLSREKIFPAIFGMPSRRWIGHRKAAKPNRHETSLSHGSWGSDRPNQATVKVGLTTASSPLR